MIRLISCFTNEPRRVGHYAGFMRSGMACGTTVFFGIAAAGVSIQYVAPGLFFSLSFRQLTFPRTQVIVHFACQVASLFPVIIVIAKYVTNTNYLAEKDIVFIPKHEAEVLHIQASDDDTNVSDGTNVSDVNQAIEEKA